MGAGTFLSIRTQCFKSASARLIQKILLVKACFLVGTSVASVDFYTSKDFSPREACERMTDKEEVRNYPRSEILTQVRIKFFADRQPKIPVCVCTLPFLVIVK